MVNTSLLVAAIALFIAAILAMWFAVGTNTPRADLLAIVFALAAAACFAADIHRMRS